MSRRDIKLDQYKISTYAYRELHNFCLQYPEKKKELADIRNPYRSPQITGIPGSSDVGNPTAEAAERAEVLARDIELIEQTAIEVDPEWYQCLVLSVTNDIPWYNLRLCKDLQLGEKTFAKRRRKFYYLLAQKKKII